MEQSIRVLMSLQAYPVAPLARDARGARDASLSLHSNTRD